MENDHFIGKHDGLCGKFERVFQRLLAAEEFDLYAEGVSLMFEVIATNFLAKVPERKYMWYDGVSNLTVRMRKSNQVVFKGEMWVADDRKQWKEDFQAVITDKRVTKQGIWIVLWVGSDKSEGELMTAFGSVE